MTNQIQVYKAQGITGEPIDSLIIHLEEELPPFNSVQESMERFEAQAISLAYALIATLPGGTLDQLLIRLLKNKATAFRVPMLTQNQEE